jgi:xylose dehydrogenase (NAD/NADP)
VTERIRWGILGNATIARVCVIPAIQNSRNGKVWALGTRSPSLAEELAARNRIARVYDGYHAVLADPEVQAVYIPLPNQLHHPWALRALGAGKHVLCEKPLACTAREAEEMAAVARARGLLLMEALMYRFHPRSRRIREMVTDGAIGTPSATPWRRRY